MGSKPACRPSNNRRQGRRILLIVTVIALCRLARRNMAWKWWSLLACVGLSLGQVVGVYRAFKSV